MSSNCDKSSERKFEYLLMFKYEVLYMKFFYDTLFLLSDNVDFFVERKDQTFPAQRLGINLNAYNYAN